MLTMQIDHVSTNILSSGGIILYHPTSESTDAVPDGLVERLWEPSWRDSYTQTLKCACVLRSMI